MDGTVEKSFLAIVDGEVEEFVAASKAFNTEIMTTMAITVTEAFKAEFGFINEGVARKKPTSDEELERMTEPISSILCRIQKLRDDSRISAEYSNHMATISESAMALSWITVEQNPVQYIRDMKEAGDYFGNRVLTANKGNELHVTWINKWNAVLIALQNYVRNHHLTGFAWNVATTKKAYVPIAPVVRPPCEGPPPIEGFAPRYNDPAAGADRQALLQQLNQGIQIVNTLKPVNRQAVGKPEGRQSDDLIAQVARTHTKKGPFTIATTTRPAVFELDGKKWRLEYQKNAAFKNLLPNDKSESLAMYKCEDSNVETKAKMNAVTIDNCKKCSITLQHIISSVELIRCERLQIRCLGSCPNITIDNCDSVQVFLNDSSENCEVISSKSTSINVCRLDEDGDYDEFPVPEQIKSVLKKGKLQSTVIEHCM